jgi:hypothetical protein
MQAQEFEMVIPQRPFERQEDQSEVRVARIAKKNPAG